MRFIIGLGAFWSSIFGLMIFIKKKTKIKSEFLLALSFTLVGIIMFIAGILNIMKLTVLFLVLFGDAILLYNFIDCIRKKTLKKNIIDSFNKIKEEKMMLPIVLQVFVFAYITIMGFNVHLMHYDNFHDVYISLLFHYHT